jgi:hypothetical protein
MDIEDFEGTTPELKLEEYFLGKTKAWGIFEDRFGNLRREFTVDIEGTWDGKTLTLVEDFLYSDGETDQRIWKITKTAENTYVGEANDIIGKAKGRSVGKALTWSYDFMLKVADSEYKVRFEDWFYLQSKDVLINKADVTKFGIKLGRATIFFQRVSSQAVKAPGLGSSASDSSSAATDDSSDRRRSQEAA